MTSIPKFVFMFYTYKGFKCNVLMLLTKKFIFFVGHLGFHAIENKTAELSQRRPRDAPNMWVP